jgi:hypothetical protein
MRVFIAAAFSEPAGEAASATLLVATVRLDGLLARSGGKKLRHDNSSLFAGKVDRVAPDTVTAALWHEADFPGTVRRCAGSGFPDRRDTSLRNAAVSPL